MTTPLSVPSAGTNVREIFEAACEANASLRQEHQHEVAQLKADLKKVEEKAATLRAEVDAAIQSKEHAQKELVATCDTLAALQQELELSRITHERDEQEVRAAARRSVHLERELQAARTVRSTTSVGDLLV